MQNTLVYDAIEPFLRTILDTESFVILTRFVTASFPPAARQVGTQG